MARIVLLPIGSHGDVHPFAAIGREMKRRGHRVTMIAAEPFCGIAAALGFDYVPTLTDGEYQSLMNHPDLWDAAKGLRVVFDEAILRKYIPIQYDLLKRAIEPGGTVVVAGTMGYSARILQETHGVPLVTVHLQPMSLCSVADPPVHPAGHDMTWLPKPLIRLAYWAAEKFQTDPMLRPAINDFRRTLHLPPVSRVLTRWASSPELVLGTFPKWFGPVPDAGPAFRHVGFVPYDDANARPTPPTLSAFLADGPPPVVFSFGSAMRTGRPYFEAAVEACTRANVRGVLLAKGGDQIPPALPANVVQFDYAPFSEVFPQAAAVVHHGGIGTTAQALWAGVPQLIMPMAFDQADNATRLRRLGLARIRFPKKFTGANVAGDLKSILADEAMKRTARDWAPKIDDGCAVACDEIERLVRQAPRETTSTVRSSPGRSAGGID
jgi:UDP:flavonoid glycosyltransferase YjiC (YdhE family)